MFLSVDMGNSETKLALFDRGVISKIIKIKTKEVLESTDFFDTSTFSNVPCGIISVVSEKTDTLKVALEKYGFKVKFINHKDFTYEHEYQTFETLGLDRMANIAGGFFFSKPPFITISLGTCVTAEYVDCTGKFCGGIIMPDAKIQAKALNSFTSKLPRVKPVFTDDIFGKTTDECIRSGVMNGILFSVKGFIEHAVKISDKKPTVIITGGLSEVFKDRLDYDILEQNLTHYGIKALYGKI